MVHYWKPSGRKKSLRESTKKEKTNYVFYNLFTWNHIIPPNSPRTHLGIPVGATPLHGRSEGGDLFDGRVSLVGHQGVVLLLRDGGVMLGLVVEGRGVGVRGFPETAGVGAEVEGVEVLADVGVVLQVPGVDVVLLQLGDGFLAAEVDGVPVEIFHGHFWNWNGRVEERRWLLRF